MLVRGWFAAVVVLACLRTDVAAAPPADRPVYVHVYAAEGLSEAARLQWETALTEGVRAGGFESVASGSAGQVPPGSEAAASAGLSRADTSVIEAQQKIRVFELDAAIDMLDWAMFEYGRYLPQLIERDAGPAKYVEALSLLAIALYLNGDEAGAVAALERAFVVNPQLDYDERVFPPQMKEMVLEGRFLSDERGTGSLRVGSVEGAAIYVNGVAAGTSAALVHDLRVGPNVVTVTMAGAEPQVSTVRIEQGGVREEKVSIEVMASRESGALAGTKAEVGDPVLGKALTKAASALKVEVLVLAVAADKVSGAGAAQPLTIYVYDVREKRLAGASPGELLAATPAVSMRELARTAVEASDWREPLVPTAARPPLWKHRYFWPAVAAVAGTVLVTTAIVVIANDGLSNGQKIGLLPLVSF